MKIARDSNGELVYAYKGIELDKSEYYACPTCGEPVQICQKKNTTSLTLQTCLLSHLVKMR